MSTQSVMHEKILAGGRHPSPQKGPGAGLSVPGIAPSDSQCGGVCGKDIFLLGGRKVVCCGVKEGISFPRLFLHTAAALPLQGYRNDMSDTP